MSLLFDSFDDLNVEDTEDYNLYKNIDGNKSKEVSSILNTCIMLSYGESDGITPIATFSVIGFEDDNGNWLTEEDARVLNGTILFQQIEVMDGAGCQIKDNGSKILIKCNPYLEICKNIEKNNSAIELTSFKGEINPQNVDMVRETLGHILASMPGKDEIKELVQLQGTPLKEAEGIYLNEAGEEMGSNYTIFPFENRFLKRLIKEYYSDEEKDNSYVAGDNQIEPQTHMR